MPFQKKNRVGQQFQPGNREGAKPRLPNPTSIWNLKQFSAVKDSVVGLPNAARAVAAFNEALGAPEIQLLIHKGLKRCLEHQNPHIYLKAVSLILAFAPREQIAAAVSEGVDMNPAALKRALAKLNDQTLEADFEERTPEKEAK